jgi:putative transposase
VPRKSLVAVVWEAWVEGILMRKVDDLVQTLGTSGISNSQVSRHCTELDERVGMFLNCKLKRHRP